MNQRPKCYLCKKNEAILISATNEGLKPFCHFCYDKLRKEWLSNLLKGNYEKH